MTKKIQFRAFIPPILSGIRTGGDSMRITLDIPESDVGDAVALIALRDTPLRITVEVDGSPVATKSKAAKESGPYGKFWQRLVANGIESHPDLQQVLSDLGWMDNNNDVASAMREAFNVTSRSYISPESLERWATQNHLTSLVTFSRNARAAVETANAKAS